MLSVNINLITKGFDAKWRNLLDKLKKILELYIGSTIKSNLKEFFNYVHMEKVKIANIGPLGLVDCEYINNVIEMNEYFASLFL